MRRTERKLTAKQVAGASKPGEYQDGGGLWLEVDEAGRRYWRWRYRKDGRRRTMSLGPYDVEHMGLADARAERDRWRDALRDGKDPMDERKRQATPEKAAMTFGEACDAYISAHRGSWKHPKHIAQWERSLGGLPAAIRSKPVSGIGTDDVLGILRPIWSDKPNAARKLRGEIEIVLDAARAQGAIPPSAPPNPARWRGHLDKLLARRPQASKRHFEAMPWQEVPSFFASLRPLEIVSARALEFLILTAARSAEVRGATLREFDLDAAVWSIAAGRMKAGREHRVPLPSRAVAIVREMLEAFPDAKLIFPGRWGGVMSDVTLTMFLRDRGLSVTVHGFRSTFRDWAGEATSYPREIAEAALAHAVGDQTETAYRRGDALERRRGMMDAWQAFLEGGHIAKIVPLRRGA